MAIANRASDFFHFFRDHKEGYICKNQYIFPFLPFHMIDKHSLLPYNRNYIGLSDLTRNMHIAMSNLIKPFNFKVVWCPRPEFHGNAYSDGSWKTVRPSKVKSAIDQIKIATGKAFCVTFTVIALGRDSPAHGNSHLTTAPGR